MDKTPEDAEFERAKAVAEHKALLLEMAENLKDMRRVTQESRLARHDRERVSKRPEK